ncbi:MAG: hypothetical protein SFV54_05685 [Bryobacteraceae bacterium]|nr:hypothetical protein [Bryobacteraceae bacterium]
MGRIAMVAALLVWVLGCAPAPIPDRLPPPLDPTKEGWYGQTVSELQAVNREAGVALSRKDVKKAGALVAQGQPLANRVLAVPRPPLAAMEAAADLDELYGRLLLGRREFGFARQVYQKNLARWKHWQPRTEETERRLREAREAIAECDRRIGAQRPQ